MKTARKTWTALAGAALIVVGVCLLVLPGPGLLVILAGLLVLAREFEQPRRLVEPLRRRLHRRRHKDD